MDDYAIVQSPDFGTLFVLSREQNVTETKLDVSTRQDLHSHWNTCTDPLQALITRAVELGSKRSLIKVNDQSDCLHT